MLPLTEKEKKRLEVLLINTCVVYWPSFIFYSFLERIQERIDDVIIQKEGKKTQKYFAELKQIIVNHKMLDNDIVSFIKNMDNPRKEWNDNMRKYRYTGRETRDNKGNNIYPNTTQCKPIRDENNNIVRCQFNSIRYPKKNRSLRTWKKFYAMFPKQAELDGWDGKTSTMKK